MDEKLASILALYNEAAPLQEAHTIPAPWYLDGEIERLEQGRVFGENWQAIGRIDQVAHPGDYFTAEFASCAPSSTSAGIMLLL
jgi:choline monooxygenase